VRFSAGRAGRGSRIDSLHRDTSLLVIVLIVVHVVTSVLDGFAPIKLTDGIIPFATRTGRCGWPGGALVRRA